MERQECGPGSGICNATYCVECKPDSSRASADGRDRPVGAASPPRARPLCPYGELSTRLMISFARGSYAVANISRPLQ